MQPPPSDIMQVSPSIITIIAILGGLLGSILTVAIGKILDLIQKRQEQKYSLQKAFFEKKLRVAEAIAGKCQKTIDVLGPISKILTKMLDSSTTFESKVFLISEMKTFLSSQPQKIQQDTDDYIYAASLYFDRLKLDPVTIPFYEKVFNSLVTFLLLAEKAKTLTPDTPETEREKIRGETIQSIADIKSDIDSVRTMIDKLVYQLRDEMKRYEP